MSESSLSVSFSQSNLDGSSNLWARLEQKYKGKNQSATLGDLAEMLTLVNVDMSALNYLKGSCPYATIVDEIVTIELVFYVWLSELDLSYSLKSDIGTISDRKIIEMARSFNLPLNNTNNAVVPYIFNGSFINEMPFIARDGALIIPDPEVTIDGSIITLSEPATCVLRGDGVATGYEYTMQMVLVKGIPDEEGVINKTGYKIENLRNTITLVWNDENGEEQEDVMEFVIPQCVKDLLEECPGGGLRWVLLINDSPGPFMNVQYSTCDGKLLIEYVSDK